MISCIEIALKKELRDAEASSLIKKAASYFNINIQAARCINIVTIESDLDLHQLEVVKDEIFTNPVTQISSLAPLDIDFDFCIWIGFRPGVKDNPGATAMEAIKDHLGKTFGSHEGIYTSKRYCLKGDTLTLEDMEKLGSQLLSNSIIQQFKVFSINEWDKNIGADVKPAKVILDHTPCFEVINIDSDEQLAKISDQRNLALNPRDIPVIREYFLDPKVVASRKTAGLSKPTDVELEYISQARSDHCNHNTFQGIFRYTDAAKNEQVIENSLFKTYIKEPTLRLKDKKDWVVSVLWDNAGVGRFDEDNNYVVTGETHNSPSNMEAYGGAITGIVGVYRDPMGTGLGSKLFMGCFGYCVGDVNYNGPLKPPLHPRRLLDGVIEGVKDGGNKSGVPTTFGQTLFHSGYMGKSLVFVTALGIMPNQVKGKPSHEKKTSPGDLIIMSGGRVGKDGIHGVTASSESYSENTPAGHVQIGDPYTQKKMHDFLLICRDEGLMPFITDNGGGGLSSSIGESAMISNGCVVWLDKVPLKYEGLDMWEIWISESQERMTIAVKPEHLERFMELSAEHEVESTVIGEYTDTGKLHIQYKNETCAYVDMDLLDKGFPSWEFDAVWLSPETRGLTEPVISSPSDFNAVLLKMLERPNICSKEWILRQYDHEVQGGSVIKPLVGIHHNIPSDASVTRPVLTSQKGLAFSQSLLPWYSKIDAYHMMTCTIDEAVRRLIAVGGNFNHIGGLDNFCWPNIQFDPKKNPDGKFKAAQLVRACRALKNACEKYEIPLLSGKDSMYVDGHLEGEFGERIKVSALETVQFSATSVIEDISKCVSMDPKVAGDLVYVLGSTANELGGSEYYEVYNETGLNVPQVDFDKFKVIYRALQTAIETELVASCHAVARGGIGIHLSYMAMAGGLGLDINLSDLVLDVSRGELFCETALFSESAGRFIVTIAPESQIVFEKLFKGMAASCIGVVTNRHDRLKIFGLKKEMLVDLSLQELDTAFNKTFGDMI
ncbi:MAG: phosphoribosylformylglycinamidine synthase [Proteobacteria bacterium]|nr:phosphoribosylformylglycinamidine synthase [Pseudomonadota bacterium]MBU1581360.1 phosphoribosylformylglycinamidine synthase [Pseudomonadota bacterium]MBU2454253.1 phosphoribosylformylglycinamidine synthase [Pseudomonadota bacterium]